MMDGRSTQTRRRLLATCAGATAGVAGLAGCTADDENDDGENGDDGSGDGPGEFDEENAEYGVWPMAHYDAANTAVAPNSGPEGEPEEKWSIEFDGRPTTPVAADGIAYVGVWNNPYYAIDIAEGERIWDYETGEFGIPVVSTTTVYVSGNGIEALDREDGDQIWASNHEPLFDLCLHEGIIYGRTEQYIYGVDAESGDERLEVEASAEVVSFGIDDEKIIVKTNIDEDKYQLEAYETGSGNFLWDYEIYQSNWGQGGHEFPIIDGTVFTRDEKTLMSINGETGESQEVSDFEFNLTVSATVFEDTVYAPILINEFPAVDTESGEHMSEWDWDPLLGAVSWRTPISNKTLYVWVSRGVSSGFVLIAVDPETAEKKWEFESEKGGDAAGPVVLNDVILFPDDSDNRLVAIE